MLLHVCWNLRMSFFSCNLMTSLPRKRIKQALTASYRALALQIFKDTALEVFRQFRRKFVDLQAWPL